jgi:hypothetical protein
MSDSRRETLRAALDPKSVAVGERTRYRRSRPIAGSVPNTAHGEPG